MSERATRCPHCQTSFYVSHLQLQSANGLVRCGACLQVFDASKHWVEQLPNDDNSGQLEFTSFDEALDTEGDLLADLKRDNATVLTTARETPSFRPVPQNTNFIAETSFTASDNAQTEVAPETDEIPETAAVTDDSESFPADSGDTAEPETVEADFQATEDREIDPADDNSFSPDTMETEAEDSSVTDSDEPTSTQDQETWSETDADTREDSLRAIREELVTNQRRSRRNGLWLLLTLLAALGLGGQYVYYYFDELVQSPYRYWFERGCTLVRQYTELSCELPPAARLEMIRTSELVVRSHPDREGALRVDAIIRNDAPFDQPYPALQLQFTDLNGEVVAARRFQPLEYLGGEVQSGDNMPSQQGIRIVLELLDPAPNAVNYQLLFFPATAE